PAGSLPFARRRDGLPGILEVPKASRNVSRGVADEAEAPLSERCARALFAGLLQRIAAGVACAGEGSVLASAADVCLGGRREDVGHALGGGHRSVRRAAGAYHGVDRAVSELVAHDLGRGTHERQLRRERTEAWIELREPGAGGKPNLLPVNYVELDGPV